MSLTSVMISPEVMKAHRATWYVWAGGVKMRHQATMRAFWGHDVTCSCGEFESRTGGATRRSVEDMLFSHRLSAQVDADVRDGNRCPECRSVPGTACYSGRQKLDYMHAARYAVPSLNAEGN